MASMLGVERRLIPLVTVPMFSLGASVVSVSGATVASVEGSVDSEVPPRSRPGRVFSGSGSFLEQPESRPTARVKAKIRHSILLSLEKFMV